MRRSPLRIDPWAR